MTAFTGIIPALTTPFDARGEIVEKKYREQIAFMLKKGVHGVCFGGSTGEGHALSIEEFRRLAEITVEEVKGKVPVVAGIIANSTREVIRRGEAIADLKIDALQVTPVFYVFTPDDESNVRHFKAITKALNAPVLLYNVIPWNLLSTDLVLRILNEIPLVVGIKQSQGHITRVAELVANAPKDKFILAAVDNLLWSCFKFGAHGTLAASPTAAPGPCVRLWNAVKKNDDRTGLAIHHRLVNFWSSLPHGNLPACVKYALELQGVDCGVSRAPMPMPDAATKKRIEKTLRPLLEYDL
ncbi:MAG: dihydrodipicolinate synthase family protein [Methylobacteriaceae bacterium]|nr:dihydrodipicolinate synthase family protein [Methylobacteriaceae bacterium]